MTIRITLPTRWEAWELGIQLALLPLVLVPRCVGVAGCRLAAACLLRRGSRYYRDLLRRVPRPISRAAELDLGSTVHQSEALMLYDRVLVLRGALFPWWKGSVAVTGLEHVLAGLEAGHGVILWVHPCLGSSVAVKQSLFEAGFPLAHLTRPAHGFSPHPFGVRFVNPLLRRAENRFLAERIVIGDGKTVGPLRRLRALLSANRVVSITVTTEAERLQEYGMLDGIVTLPNGPVEIAAKTGATILPVFTVGSSSPRRVLIGAPLPVVGTDGEAARSCHRASVEWLREQVAEHPLDWVGWRTPVFRRLDRKVSPSNA